MSTNNNNNRSRSSSLPPLRQGQVRTSVLPSASSPILEQAGEVNEITMVNDRLSVLEDLIRSLIPSIPIEGTATISATSSSSTSLPEPAAETAAPTIDKREVNKRHFTTTSASVMSVFKENKINSTCRDSFARISMIRGALSTANLRNMLDGYRTMPIVTNENLYGYSERRSISGSETDFITGLIRPIKIMLEEDDIYYFEHDKGRLFMAVIEMFHHDLRYLVPQEIENCDGVGMYVKIMEHLNGQRGRDVDAAKEAINNYRMNESITFKQEKAKFEDIFKTLEYAQRSKMKDSEKIQFLISRLVNDRRVGLKDVIIQARVNNLSYDQTVENLIRINAEMSESNQTVKMAAMIPPKSNKTKANNNETQIKYCYNFNESGECRFGASCIYSHSKDPNHLTREPRSKPIPDKSQPPNPVGKLHRSPNGGEKFKGGYKGKSPIVRFNKASSSEENTSFKSMNVNNESIINQSPSSLRPFESWSNVNQKPFVVTHESLNNISMKMIRANQLGSSEQEDDFPDDQNPQEIPVKRTSSSTDPRPYKPFRSFSCSILAEQKAIHCRIFKQYMNSTHCSR